MSNKIALSSVFRFYGNQIPFLFIKNSSSRGFVSDNCYYKEILTESNEEAKVEYKKSDVRLKKINNTFLFKITNNFFYYLLLMILVFAAYNNDCLDVVLLGGGAIGVLIWFALERFGQFYLLMLLSIIAAITFYGAMKGYYEIAYLVYFSILAALILENYKKIVSVYRVINDEGKETGYFIWTDEKEIYTASDKIKQVLENNKNRIVDENIVKQEDNEEKNG